MSIRLTELVERLGGELIGDANAGNVVVTGIAPLDAATASHITFLSNAKFRGKAERTQAAALILSPQDDAALGPAYGGVRIVTANPYAYFAHAAQWFAALSAPPVAPGVHASAVVD